MSSLRQGRLFRSNSASHRRTGKRKHDDSLASILEARRLELIDLRAATGAIVESLEKRVHFGLGPPGEGPNDIPQSCDCPDCTTTMATDPNSGAPDPSNPSATTVAPIVYRDGRADYSSTDLSASGIGGSFNWTRNWTGLNGSSQNGNGWMVLQLPFLVLSQNQFHGLHSGIVTAVESGGINSWFDSTSPDSTIFNGRYYSHAILTYAPHSVVSGHNVSGSFTLTDSTGGVTTFYDLPRIDDQYTGTALAGIGRLYGYASYIQKVVTQQSDDPYPLGAFKSYRDPYGNVTAATYDADTNHTSAGLLTYLTRTDAVSGAEERYKVDYTSVSNTNGISESLISKVTLQHHTNSGAAWIDDRSAEYTYYTGDTNAGTSGAAFNGRLGDLHTVTIKDAAGNVIDQKYYRYNKEFTSNGSNTQDETINGTNVTGGSDMTLWQTGDDADHTLVLSGLKSATEGAFYSRLTANNGTSLSTLDGLSDATVNAYANNSFVYSRDYLADLDENRYGAWYRVNFETAAGNGCSTCTGGFGTYRMEYFVNDNANEYPNSTLQDPNAWMIRTTEYLPDDTPATWDDNDQQVVYTNEIGEVLLKVLIDKHGTTDTSDDTMQGWFYQYDAQGRLILSADPAAVDLSAGLSTLEGIGSHLLYDNDLGQYLYLRPYDGMITRTDYYGATDSGLTDGSSGTSNVSGGALGYIRDHTVQRGQLNGALTPTTFTHSGTTATVTFGSTHNFNVGDVVHISGASPNTYDGQFVILSSSSSTSFTIALSTTPAGDPSGGTSIAVVRPTLLDKQTYFARTDGSGAYIYPLATYTQYRNTDETGAQTTSSAYTWYSGTFQMKSRATTMPGISATQNGPGTASADVDTSYFDNFNRVVFHKDGDGYIDATRYDYTGSNTSSFAKPGTNDLAVVTTIRDADTSISADFDPVFTPSSFSLTSPTSGSRLHLTNSVTLDGLGRATKFVDANANVTDMTYNDANHESRTYPGWHAVGTNNTTSGPVTISREYRGTQGTVYNEVITATILPHSGAPTGSENFYSGGTAGGTIQTLSRTYQNDAGQAVRNDRYFSLGTGTNAIAYATTPYLGSANASLYYDTTTMDYDGQGRLKRTVAPTGTINRYVYDARGLLTSQWIGAGSDDNVGGPPYWSPTNHGAMTKIADYFYDGNTPGTITTPTNFLAGAGNLTRVVEYPSGTTASSVRVTEMFFDWRNRQVATKTGVYLDANLVNTAPTNETSGANGIHRLITYNTYDNLNEITQTELYQGDGVTISTTDGVPDAPAGTSRVARTQFFYDDQQRPYRTSVFSVDQSNGTNISGSSLDTNTFYDHRGDVMAVAQPGGLWSKYVIDGAGRVIKQYSSDGGALNVGTNAGTWSNAGNVTNDVVVQQVENTYDNNGNATLVTTRDRFHDAATNGAGLGDLRDPSNNPKARVSFQAYYYDAANRTTDALDVGTAGSTNGTFSRPGSPWTRSGTALVTTYGYDDAGRQDSITDTRGHTNKTYFDMASRPIRTIANWDGSDQSPASNSTPSVFSSTSQIADYTYDGSDHVLTMKAWGTNSSTFQTTQYVYGVTTSTSGINSNDLLLKVEYPNTSTNGTAGAPGTTSAFIVSYTYNALGDKTGMTDRNQTTHAYAYDAMGRPTSDTVTAFGSGVNDHVKRLGYSYDTAGRLAKSTSYFDTSGTNAVSEVWDVYNGLGQLTREYQDHDSLASTNSVSVGYTYSEMSGGNHSRPTSMIYPDGRTITYDYDGANGLDNAISRVSGIGQGAGTNHVTLEGYKYLGLSTIVEKNRPLEGVKLSYIQQPGDASADSTSSAYAGDQYTGLDRFGRVKDQWWFSFSGTTVTATLDRFQYGYDAGGNVLYKNNLGPGTNAASFSELYHANSSTSSDDATAYDAMNRLTAFRRGTLSSSGNNGSGLDTVSTSNTNIAGLDGARSWGLDALGNSTSITTDGSTQNRTSDSQNELKTLSVGTNTTTLTYDSNGNLTHDDNGNTITYDAWDRLRNVGAKTFDYLADRRFASAINFGNFVARDYYYSKDWQIIEEDDLFNPGFGPVKQNVWGIGYVDDQIERDRYYDDDGNPISPTERLWVQQDANHNVTSIADNNAAVQERMVYDPYGSFKVLTSTWGASSDSYSWDYYHQGGRWDADLQLYNFRNRWYSPTMETWTQQDPASARYLDGPNLYAYDGSAPTEFSDPTGLSIRPGWWQRFYQGSGWKNQAPNPDKRCKCGDCKCLRIVATQAAASMAVRYFDRFFYPTHDKNHDDILLQESSKYARAMERIANECHDGGGPGVPSPDSAVQQALQEAKRYNGGTVPLPTPPVVPPIVPRAPLPSPTPTPAPSIPAFNFWNGLMSPWGVLNTMFDIMLHNPGDDYRHPGVQASNCHCDSQSQNA
jgi:RHS repeat-associated protein